MRGFYPDHDKERNNDYRVSLTHLLIHGRITVMLPPVPLIRPLRGHLPPERGKAFIGRLPLTAILPPWGRCPHTPARFFTLCKFDLPNQRFGVSLMKKSGAKNFICAARTSFAALWKDITDGT